MFNNEALPKKTEIQNILNGSFIAECLLLCFSVYTLCFTNFSCIMFSIVNTFWFIRLL